MRAQSSYQQSLPALAAPSAEDIDAEHAMQARQLQVATHRFAKRGRTPIAPTELVAAPVSKKIKRVYTVSSAKTRINGSVKEGHTTVKIARLLETF
ncbi:hypothetical protein L916_18483 [Phytophthora nicotianae]|uniref:Uncharacterized protein n=1 Tax=Phytophthora nicotianae TaxID=4792 RepID=W2I3P5_PHYNI|nr:hypothetical protein L916_18483 [Phytophthora nicotianae]